MGLAMNSLSEPASLSEFIHFDEFLGFRMNSLSVPCSAKQVHQICLNFCILYELAKTLHYVLASL